MKKALLGLTLLMIARWFANRARSPAPVALPVTRARRLPERRA